MKGKASFGMIWSNMSEVQGIGIDINILWMAEKSTWPCKSWNTMT